MYNGQRPHSSLGDKTPWEFMACSVWWLSTFNWMP